MNRQKLYKKAFKKMMDEIFNINEINKIINDENIETSIFSEAHQENIEKNNLENTENINKNNLSENIECLNGDKKPLNIENNLENLDKMENDSENVENLENLKNNSENKENTENLKNNTDNKENNSENVENTENFENNTDNKENNLENVENLKNNTEITENVENLEILENKENNENLKNNLENTENLKNNPENETQDFSFQLSNLQNKNIQIIKYNFLNTFKILNNNCFSKLKLLTEYEKRNFRKKDIKNKKYIMEIFESFFVDKKNEKILEIKKLEESLREKLKFLKNEIEGKKKELMDVKRERVNLEGECERIFERFNKVVQ